MKTNSWKYCSETIKNIKMFKAAGIDSLAGSFLIDDALVLLKKKLFIKLGINPDPWKLPKVKLLSKKRFKDETL